MIGELAEFIKDEAKGIKKYAKMAIKLKAQNKDLAELFYRMANTESTHLDSIHEWAVKYIEKERKERPDKIPQGMLDVWEWEHSQLVECLAESKLMLQKYEKMVV